MLEHNAVKVPQNDQGWTSEVCMKRLNFVCVCVFTWMRKIGNRRRRKGQGFLKMHNNYMERMYPNQGD